MFFDSHCHLDRIPLEGFDYSVKQLMQQNDEAQVTEMLCIGVDLESFPSLLSTIESYDHVFASVGVHPDYENVKEPDVEILLQLAEHKKVVAIGETGLDYFHSKGDLSWQRKRFITHIEAAKTANLPLIIHTRNAREDTIDLLKRESAEQVGGVLHCFTEDFAMAEQAMDLNFYISISGIVTFKQAVNVQEMAAQIPDDRLLIETDSPWLSPEPYRGKTNYPGQVRLVAEKLAELRRCSTEHIAKISRQNAAKLFNISLYE